jgi:hypothetical protein
MIGLMAKRIRMIIDTDEEVRLAVRLAATKADIGISELVTEILRKALPLEISDAKRYLPKKKAGTKEEG